MSAAYVNTKVPLAQFDAVMKFIDSLSGFEAWDGNFGFNGKGQISDWWIQATPAGDDAMARQASAFKVRYYQYPGTSLGLNGFSIECEGAVDRFDNIVDLYYALEDLA